MAERQRSASGTERQRSASGTERVGPLPATRRAATVGEYLRAVAAIIRKDLTAELRSRELLGAMLVFALLVILIFNFALELDVRTRRSITSGVLWVTFAFAGTLGLNRAMAIEHDRGSLDGLLLAPVDRSALFFGKALGNLLFMSIAEVIILPIYSVLYNVNLMRLELLGVIVLGSIGYVTVGTLLASMAMQARTRDILLPILLFPVVLPLLIAAVKATNGILEGFPLSDYSNWLNLLLAYDVILLAVAVMTFDFVVEE